MAFICVIIYLHCKLHGHINEESEEPVAYMQLFCKLCLFVANRSHRYNSKHFPARFVFVFVPFHCEMCRYSVTLDTTAIIVYLSLVIANIMYEYFFIFWPFQ